MSMLQIGATGLMMFLGCTALSATGFGIGMVAMPGLLFVLEPQTAVVMLNTVAIAVEAWIVVQARRDIPFREVLPIVVAGALGVPFAVLILKFADPGVMRIGISLLVLTSAAIATFRLRREFPYSKIVGVIAGLTVGIVLPAFGVGGPLVTLYLLTRSWRRQSVRAAMAFFLLTLDVFGIAGYAVAGFYTAERMTLIALMMIPMLGGLGLGALILRLMSERIFRYAAVSLIVSSSALVLVKELLRL